MKKPRKVQFKVTFTLPEGASVAAAKELVFEAVTSWGGGYQPKDEMFGHRDDVKVTTLYTKRTR